MDGLQTTWILATLGSKAQSRFSKREIIEVSIPQICSQLLLQQKNIRYAANILHGLCMLYRVKVVYLQSDSAYIQLRLRQNNSIKKYVQTESYKQDTKRGPIFLANDKSFDIELGLVEPFEFPESSEAKKRKLMIKEYDQRLFPSAVPNVTFETDMLTQTISNYLDQIGEEKRPEFELDLDFDMGIRDKSDIEALNLSLEPEKDEDFHLSTEQTMNTPSRVEPEKKERFRKMVIDESIYMPEVQQSLAKDDMEVDLAEVLQLKIPMINYINSMTFPSIKRSLVDREIETGLRRDIDGDIEVGREAQASTLNALEEFDLGLDYQPNLFDLSFNISSERGQSAGSQYCSHPDHAAGSESAGLNLQLSQFLQFAKDHIDGTRATFAELIPNLRSAEEVIPKRLAATSFASILALATRSELTIETSLHKFELLTGEDIIIGL